MTQLSPSSAVATSAIRTYSNRSNCIAGARAALKRPEAKPGADFDVYTVEDRFAWKPHVNGRAADVVEPGIPKFLDRALAAAQGRTVDAALLAPAASLMTTTFASEAPKAAAPAAPAKAAAAADGKVRAPRPGTKMEIAFKMLRTAEGATQKAMSEATGWPTVNLKQMAKRTGLKVEQNGDRFRLV